MDVSLRGRVDVHVDEVRNAGRMAHVEPGLLTRLPQGRLGRRFARLEVTTRLEPPPEAAVPVQHGAAPPDHDPGSREVDRTGVAIERGGQRPEGPEDAIP